MYRSFEVYGLVLHALRAGCQDFFTLRLSSFYVETVFMFVDFYCFLMQMGKIVVGT
jgi:hypothetical protein